MLQNPGTHSMKLLVASDAKNDPLVCIKCQEDKINQQPLYTPLNPHNIPKQPWQKVTADMIGRLPKSNGFNTIEVFTDTYTCRTFTHQTQHRGIC